MLAPRYDAARSDFERVLKQRNALLRGGVRDDGRARRPSTCSTSSSSHAGAELVRGRLRLVERLVPAIAAAYDDAGRPTRGRSTARYEARVERRAARRRPTPTTIEDQLRDALDRRRRGRDRPRASRSSVRTATSWRLDDRRARRAAPGVARRAAHARARVAARGPPGRRASSPARRRCCCSTTCSASSTRTRAAALVRNLPPGQTLLTTAGALPPEGVAPSAVCASHDGRVDRGPVVTRPTSSATSRCRCATRSRRSAASSACPRPTSLATRRRRVGRDRRAGASRAHARRALRARRRVHDRRSTDPAWATQLRYLEPDLVERAATSAAGRAS